MSTPAAPTSQPTSTVQPATIQPAGQAGSAPVLLDDPNAPGHPLRAQDVTCFVEKEIG